MVLFFVLSASPGFVHSLISCLPLWDCIPLAPYLSFFAFVCGGRSCPFFFNHARPCHLVVPVPQPLRCAFPSRNPSIPSPVYTFLVVVSFMCVCFGCMRLLPSLSPSLALCYSTSAYLPFSLIYCLTCTCLDSSLPVSLVSLFSPFLSFSSSLSPPSFLFFLHLQIPELQPCSRTQTATFIPSVLQPIGLTRPVLGSARTEHTTLPPTLVIQTRPHLAASPSLVLFTFQPLASLIALFLSPSLDIGTHSPRTELLSPFTVSLA